MRSDRRHWLFRALGGATMLAAGQEARASEATKVPASDVAGNACAPLLAHALRPLVDGVSQPLCEEYGDKVLLIVNTASKCGFTPQFEALETLSRRYAERGFHVLGFPSDDFRQELADEKEVARFCELNYGVTFPMFEKISVSGRDAHPLYRDLARDAGQPPDWNFNKYLIDRQGRAMRHYGSSVLPLGERLIADIEALL